MYNKVIMLGRIVQDLELRTTSNGTSVLSFRIAVDRRFQTKGEEKKTDFFDCVAWRQEAEFISRFWSKGRAILIEGELQNRTWQDKDGNNRITAEIIVDRASFTGEAKQSNQGGGYSSGGYTPPAPAQHPAQQANSAPTAANGSYTANDFVETTNTDDNYPF